MIESFRLGGFPMFPTLLFGLMLVAAAVRYAMKPEMRWVPLQIALAVLTLASGAFGFVTGLILTTINAGGAGAKMSQLTTVGFGESLCNMSLAFALVAAAALAACIGAARLAGMLGGARSDTLKA